MPANDYVRARIDPVIKNEAAAVLAKMGLTVSDSKVHYIREETM